MTDREMLELAAKAAGLDAEGTDMVGNVVLFGGEKWNPLADDGDALRLAVKLKIRHGNDGVRASVDWWAADGITLREDQELCGSDPYAATRRAIVRAAVQIGQLA